jgi:3-oxoacyl-[acyl-carrier protein] reductase
VSTEGLQHVGIVGGEHEKALVAVTPLGRFGQPEDIAKVAVFLASDEVAWVSGERITASGGWW